MQQPARTQQKLAPRAPRPSQVTNKSLSRSGQADAPSLSEWYNETAELWPTVLCMDSNTTPTRGDPRVYKALRNMRFGMRTAFDEHYAADGSKIKAVAPVTTNKMRGPLSEQPKKIGEHMYAEPTLPSRGFSHTTPCCPATLHSLAPRALLRFGF